MLGSVFAKTVWDRRRSLWWWLAGLAGLAALMVAFWPTFAGTEDFAELLDAYPEYLLALFGIDAEEFLTAAGFFQGELYSAMLPILFINFAILRGAAIAAEEQEGTLDLTLAMPISRRRVIVDTFLAMAVLTGALGLGLVVVMVVGDPIADLGLGVAAIVAINLGEVLLALLFGALAMAVGAATGRRMLAAGVSAAVAVAAFFVNGLAPLVTALEGLQRLSPFHWFLRSKPLAHGFDWAGLGLLAATTAAFLVLAVWAFDRRDVST